MLDAIGRTINRIKRVQEHTAQEYRANKVLFVIITDGMENASREYSYSEVYKMVEHQKERYGWEFIFLGANIDAIKTSGRFGITADRAVNFYADSKGIQLNFKVVNEAITHFRKDSPLTSDWKEEIETDFERRKRRNCDVDELRPNIDFSEETE